MRNSKSILTLLSSGAAMTLALSLAAAPASAQDVPLTISPNGGGGAAPPAAAPSGGGAAPGGVDFSEGGEAGSDEEPENIYYGDYLDEGELDNSARPARRNNGAVPATHTVRTGDTLWDLSSYYFDDAWTWPKVWGLNPEISNPHWIYPGNIVRLRDGDGTPLPTNNQPPARTPSEGFSSIAAKAPQRSLGFRQIAWVEQEKLKDAATVDGSVQAKSLLATGDTIYVSYPDGKVPQVGETFSIYSEGEGVGRAGDNAGNYVSINGSLQITFAKKGKRARAVITGATREIERGMRVGPLKLYFGDVQPVPNSAKVQGSIVNVIGPDELIGAQAAVIIDRGSNSGVQVGNRFLVLRRGDAYMKVMKPSSEVAMDDEEYPARAVGEVIVVQAGKSVSLGLVTFSTHEFGVGDKVYMRKGQ